MEIHVHVFPFFYTHVYEMTTPLVSVKLMANFTRDFSILF